METALDAQAPILALSVGGASRRDRPVVVRLPSMATWLDGPEYAPRERPAEFAAPRAPRLGTAPARPCPSSGAPHIAPSDYRQEQPVAPLSNHSAPEAEYRDPHEAFAVARNVMTAGEAPTPQPTDPRQPLSAATGVDHGRQPSAWGAAHADSEYSLVNRPIPPLGGGQPQPGSQWPPPNGRPTGQPGPVTALQVLQATQAGVVISLLVGGLFGAFTWVPPIALVAAMVFSFGVRQARATVQTTLITSTAIAVVWFLMAALLNGLQVGPAIQSTSLIAVVLCWLALVVVLAMVTRSLSRGEPPTPHRP